MFPEPFVIDRESGLVPDEEFQDLDHGRCSLGVVALDLIGVGVLEQLRPVLRIDDSMTACRLVAQGLGLTVSPYYPPELRDASLCLRPLDWLFPADYLVVWSGTCRPGRASHLAARQASKGTLPCAEVWS